MTCELLWIKLWQKTLDTRNIQQNKSWHAFVDTPQRNVGAASYSGSGKWEIGTPPVYTRWIVSFPYQHAVQSVNLATKCNTGLIYILSNLQGKVTTSTPPSHPLNLMYCVSPKSINLLYTCAVCEFVCVCECACGFGSEVCVCVRRDEWVWFE